MDLHFYHLTTMTLERSLSLLLRQTIDRQVRALVRFGTIERAKWFDDYLWTFNDRQFLPHGLSESDYAGEQPILLTAEQTDQRVNGAAYVFWIDGFWPENFDSSQQINLQQQVSWPFDASAERLSVLFLGNDEQQRGKARQLYQWAQKCSQVALSYWKQDEKGTWHKPPL